MAADLLGEALTILDGDRLIVDGAGTDHHHEAIGHVITLDKNGNDLTWLFLSNEEGLVG